MADLKFVDQHNMVACLENTKENDEFHQIFWNTATSKTVNSVKQKHAIVDGKAVVISESSVRSDLLFNDEDGIAYLTNDEIFKNLALMGYEQLSTKLTFQKGMWDRGNQRADGSSKNYMIFSEMLDDFDRQDVIDLHRLDYNWISWRLFDSCGVHVLLMNIALPDIHMMIEKKYPLTQEMLSRMLNRRLEVDYESEMAFELIRFTKSQLQK
ncbi:hypothetical protein Tco_1154866 [Tanacetum coccineum]